MFQARVYVVLAAAFVSSSHAQVRAVISNCCSGSGSILEIDGRSFQIERSLDTGVDGAFGFTVSQNFALGKEGRTGVVLSETIDGPYVGPVLTTVDLATGAASPPLAVPAPYNQFFPLAVNPQTGAIYYSYSESTGDSHVQEIDPAATTILNDVDVGQVISTSLAVSPDGRRLYLSTAYGEVIVLEASGLSVVGIFSSCNLPIAISPDSATVYVVGCNGIEFISTATLLVTQTIPFSGYANGAGVSPDGASLYFTDGQTQSICTLRIGTLVPACAAVDVSAYAVNVSPNGTVYIGAHFGYGVAGELAIFDPATEATHQVLASYQLPSEGFLAVSPTGNQVYYVGAQVSQISSTGPVPSQQILHSATIDIAPGVGAYDAMDDRVMFQDYVGRVQVFNGTTLRTTGFVALASPISLVGFNGSGFAVASNAAPTGQAEAGIVRFDPISLAATGSVKIPCGAAIFSHTALSGQKLYAFFSGESCSGIAVVDTARMTLDSILPALPVDLNAFGMPTSAARLGYGIAFPYLQAVLYQIDMNSGQILRAVDLPPVSNYIAGLAFSPDGNTLYLSLDLDSNNGDGTLLTLDAKTLAIRKSSALNIGGLLSVTPDGQYIYSTGPSGVVIISTATLQIVDTIPSIVAAGTVVFAGHP